MYSPAWGLSWQLWRRHRWGFLADVAWLTLLALMALLLPDRWRGPDAGRYLALLSGPVFIHLMAAMTYGAEVEVTDRQSGFPARMFTLPLTTWKLVAWPMALGALAMAGAWLTIDLAMLQPCGQMAPLGWPAALAAAALMTIQAVAWTPFGFGWARLIVMLPAAAMWLVPIYLKSIGVSNAAILATILPCLPLIYMAAVAGLARARRSDGLEWRWLQALAGGMTALLPHRRRRFSSAAQAQLWFECRRHAALLPFFMALLLVPLGLVLFLDRMLEARPLRVLAIILATPWMLAGIVGPAVGKHDFSARNPALPAFLATRPISSIAFFRAKLRMALVSALLVSAVAIVLPAVWLAPPGRYQVFKDAMAAAAADMPAGKLIAVAVLAAAFWAAYTWRQLAAGLYIGLTGRTWVMNALYFAFGALMFVIIPLGLALQFYPEYRPLAWQAAPWIVGAALAAKAAAACFVCRAVLRAKLVSSAVLRRWLAIWALTATSISAAIMLLVPAGALALWETLAVAACIVPFNRLAVAPLALDWDRHR